MRTAAAALGLVLLGAPAAEGAAWAIEQTDESGAVLATIALTCEGARCTGLGALRDRYGPRPARVLLRRNLSQGVECLALQPPQVTDESYRWSCDGGTRSWRMVAEDWLEYPPRRGMDRFVMPWPPSWLLLRLRATP